MSFSTSVGTFKDQEPPKIPGEENQDQLDIQTPGKIIVEQNTDDFTSMSVMSAAVSQNDIELLENKIQVLEK